MGEVMTMKVVLGPGPVGSCFRGSIRYCVVADHGQIGTRPQQPYQIGRHLVLGEQQGAIDLRARVEKIAKEISIL